ncbi:unnamed protein product, partial [Brassica rapa subsp. narinosa]
MVNIGTHDLAEGWPHLVLGLISQLIKFQLLAHLSLKKMPQLIELVVRTTKRTSEITPGENLTQMVELPSLERWLQKNHWKLFFRFESIYIVFQVPTRFMF